MPLDKRKHTMKKEYNFEKMKLKRKGPLKELEGQSVKSAKVKITISLDKDIIDYFKTKASKPGAIPYQTQINQALANLIEQEDDSTIEQIKNNLLNDKDFIKKISKKIHK
jgi:uncharacterized protein (DUF4415 family)